jgi:hypothetical protein
MKRMSKGPSKKKNNVFVLVLRFNLVGKKLFMKVGSMTPNKKLRGRNDACYMSGFCGNVLNMRGW